jgi:hypothetical protein
MDRRLGGRHRRHVVIIQLEKRTWCLLLSIFRHIASSIHVSCVSHLLVAHGMYKRSHLLSTNTAALSFYYCVFIPLNLWHICPILFVSSLFFIMLLFEGFLLCGMNGFGVCVVVLYQQWMGLGFIISYFLFCITTQQERPIAALSSDPVDLFWSPLSTNRYHRNLPHQVIIVNLAWESWTRKKGSFGGEIRKKKERREERRKKKIKKSSIKRNFVSITPDV